MAQQTKDQLKQWFRKGLYPTESQFADWIDSFWHKTEQITLSAIAGLTDILNSKQNAETGKSLISDAEITRLASVSNVDVSGKVDKVEGKSLIADSEITRLASVSNVDISGKVDKVEGKSLIADTEITRLASVSNVDVSGKVDKVEGKSLIADTEITRLASVSNVDISGKVDKVEGKSLIADTEITRLASVSNVDTSGKVDKVEGKSLISDAEITRLASVSNVDISGKVDKVEGKSLIADTEITRLASVSNVDISGKVDKVEGKSLIADTEITRLASVSNVDISGKVDKVPGKSLISDTEITRLAALKEHFKDTHLTLTALQAAYPTAVAGDVAVVDAGVGFAPMKYMWDSSDNAWRLEGNIVCKNIYVDVSATAGSNNGTSWANAFLTLDLAFSGISDYTNVWVMGGTYIFNSLITVTANNINVRGINTYAGVTPLLKSNTTTYVDLFRFSGNNILFDNFKITDRNVSDHIWCGGTSTVQANNYLISNLYFYDINVDVNKAPITGTILGSLRCLRLNYIDNLVVDNITINDVCIASAGISSGVCNNTRFNNININNFCHSVSNGVGLQITATHNGYINNIKITNCNLLRTRYLRPLMCSTSAVYGSNSVFNNVIVDNCYIYQTVLYIGATAQLQSVIVSNMIVKNCSTAPGNSGIFALNSIAGGTLTLVNCTTLYNNLSTIWQVDNFSNLKAIGCIFQEPTLLTLITTTTRVELIRCLLTPALTHNAVVTDCIVSPAEFVSISDLRLKSISAGIDHVPVTFVAPYLKYPEQWYDSNNKRVPSNLLSVGACQDIEYVTESLTPLGERGQSEVDVMSQKGVDDAFIALEEWIDVNLTQPIGQMASSQTVSDLQSTMESTTTYNDEQFGQLNQKITDDVANAWNALNGVDVQMREDFSMLVYDLDQINSRGFAKMSDIADAKAYADNADGYLQQSISNIGVAQQSNAEDISNLSLGVSAMSNKLDDTYSAVEAQGMSIDNIATDVSALKLSAQSNTSLAEAVQGNTNNIAVLSETCYNLRQQAESDRNVVGDLLNFVYYVEDSGIGYGKTIIDCYPNQFLTLLERDGVTEICFKRSLINQSDAGLVQKEYRVVVGLLQGGSLSFNFNDLQSEPLACATNPPTFEAGKFYAVELNSSFLRVTELVAI